MCTLSKESRELFISTDPDKVASGFDQCLPDVMALTFNATTGREKAYSCFRVEEKSFIAIP